MHQIAKAINDLELSLVHLQQNIDIPEVSLSIHPQIKAAIAKADEENRKVSVQDFGDKVEDTAFLNALQKGVTRWVREMQKVCSWGCLWRGRSSFPSSLAQTFDTPPPPPTPP